MTGCEGKLRFGYQLGAIFEYAFRPSFSMQTGLFMTSKGTNDFFDNEDSSVNAVYLEVPITASYRIPIYRNTNLLFNAGPYVAYGIMGITKLKQFDNALPNEMGGTVTINELNTFGDNALKNFDMGLQSGIGIEHQTIIIKLTGQHGFWNVSRRKDLKARNQTLAVSIGYRFYAQ